MEVIDKSQLGEKINHQRKNASVGRYTYQFKITNFSLLDIGTYYSFKDALYKWHACILLISASFVSIRAVKDKILKRDSDKSEPKKV